MRLTRTIDALYDATLALLYPQTCAACGAACVEARADAPACAACWEATPLFDKDAPLCVKCGAPSACTVAPESRESLRCRLCDDESFTAARACGAYKGALRASVLALKREPYVAARLARLLTDAQRRTPLDRARRILPVPLHPARLRERGFNQAASLARVLAAQTGLPCDEWSLTRVAHTEQQRAGMDARGRRESVASAFAVTRPRLLRGERVLLIDDVLTTGATVSACAAALRAAGACEVYVLTVARA
jgi:ComF family protein